MGGLKGRLARAEQRLRPTALPVIEIRTDGPPMTYGEIDDYNRRCGPDDLFLFTIRIDRREGAMDLQAEARRAVVAAAIRAPHPLDN